MLGAAGMFYEMRMKSPSVILRPWGSTCIISTAENLLSPNIPESQFNHLKYGAYERWCWMVGVRGVGQEVLGISSSTVSGLV